jgi:hypothetical protein
VTTDTRSSSADLASGLVEDTQRLVQLEIALARQEVKELLIRNSVAAGLLSLAAMLAVLCIFVAVPVLIVWLVPAHVIAALVWVAAYLVGGAILALVGRVMLKITPPQKTLTSLKETKEWALRQISSAGR